MTEVKIPARYRQENESLPVDRRSVNSALQRQIDTIDSRVGALETKLDSNTTATNRVLEIVTMAEGFFKTLGALGSAIKWVSGIVTAASVLWIGWHNTPPKV